MIGWYTKRFIRELAGRWCPDDTVLLSFPVKPRCRWPVGRPNEHLYSIINARRAHYAQLLEFFLGLAPSLATINKHPDASIPTQPSWINGWMPALDGVALYGLVAREKPKLIIEIGSGNSTKFARRAVTDHGLKTRIVSIDPQPRAEIDSLCDRVIRQPAEETDLGLYDELQSGDILYVDNSHVAMMNSDATVVFLDILPRLKPGVVVEIHDIMLPYDYPDHWARRFYSEQYLLACYLLAMGHRFEVLFPSSFVSIDPELSTVMKPFWSLESLQGVETHGVSFWLKML